MINFLRCAVVALMLTPAIASAQDFDAGYAAYEAGDYATALRKWTPIAEKGDADAQFILGWMYNSGKGVAQDDAEAVKWYRLAAEQGDADAQNNLSMVYRWGEGVPQDYVTSHMWFNIAAANGFESAREM